MDAPPAATAAPVSADRLWAEQLAMGLGLVVLLLTFLAFAHPELLTSGAKVLAPDMSLYLHRPTATDPSLAPPGCDAFYVLSPVPHLDAGIDWTVQAEPYRRAIENRLSETIMPGLAGEIVTSFVTTPRDFQDRYCSIKGAAFSLAPTLTQSAWFRPNNRSEDIEGLYLVGAGTQPGAGLPGVLSSARMLDVLVPDAAVRA